MARARLILPSLVLLATVLPAAARDMTADLSPQAFRLREHVRLQQGYSDSDIAEEQLFGRAVAARILGRFPLYRDPEQTRYLNLVGRGLALHGPRTELDYHFAILDSGEVNAYSAPGGYIFVTRGALRLMRDEAELAAVLAHEIAHVTERHIVRELDIHGQDMTSAAGIARVLGGASDTARVAVTQAVEQATAILFERGYRHRDEFQADETAMLLMATAGYDATALQRYLRRSIAAGERQRSQARATHPAPQQRLDRIAALIEQEHFTPSTATAGRVRFMENMQ